MKKGLVTAIILLLAAGAAGGGYWYYTQQAGVVSEENAVYVTEVASLTDSGSGFVNRYAGVVEAQETVEVKIESGRKVNEVKVKTGDVVKKGQLLFEYDLSSIEQDLKSAELDLERLKNEADSLDEKIRMLTKQQKEASKDSQLSYTIEIETAKMNLKKNGYDQESKQAEIERLQTATQNTDVRSSIDGVIQKIDFTKMDSSADSSVQDTLDEGMDYGYYGNGESNAFITILSTGEYRVKGSVNEMNTRYLMEGQPIIVRSRIDENEIWQGEISLIDRENPNQSQNNMWGYGQESGETTSSTYPFYVQLDSSKGLMLGQHVYIEPDMGQSMIKTGLWLYEGYLVDTDTSKPYVWAATGKNRLEKRYVTLGQYDADLGEYEILKGLETSDYIAWPTESLEEGMPTTTDISASMMDFDAGYMDMEPDAGVDFVGMPDGAAMSTYEEIPEFDEDQMSGDFEEYDFENEVLMDGSGNGAFVNEELPEPPGLDSGDDMVPVSGPGMGGLG